MVNMMLGEVAPGRYRFGPVRDADPGGDHGVRGRVDGRANTGVPGQEDRRPGDQVRLAVLPDHAGAGAGRHRRWRWRRRRPGPRCSTRARTACPRCCTRSPRRATTTARRSPASPSTPPGTTPRSGCACCSAGSCRWSSCSAWPARWPASSRCPRRPARCRPTRPLFVGMLVGVTVIVVALTYLPALALGPLAEGLLTTLDRGTACLSLSRGAGARPCSRRVGGGLLDPQAAVEVHSGRAAQAQPAHAVAQPGHVHRGDRRRSSPPCWRSPHPSVFAWLITVWLWLTVIFANLAEAVAEGRGKAQAETLRRAKTGHHRPPADRLDSRAPPRPRTRRSRCRPPQLQQGDIVVVEAGQIIPGDGDVVEGIASVDESAITGESAPVIRESGGDRVGGHRRHQGALRPDRRADHPEAGRELHRPDDRPGRGREPAEDPERDRAQHPARRADRSSSCSRWRPCSRWRSSPRRCRRPRRTRQALNADGVTGIVLVSLLVCLIPTTIGALLSAIGIAGMDRLVQRNVLAMSGRAVEAAGDVNTLLLDKTGTITLGNRQASEFLPVDGVDRGGAGRRRAAVQPGRRDPRGPLDRGLRQDRATACASASPASWPTRPGCRSPPQTRMSGVDLAEPTAPVRADPQGRRDRGDEVGPRQRRPPHRRRRSDRRRHLRPPAARRWWWPSTSTAQPARALGRHPPQGRRQAGHAASASTRCAGWASAP